MPHAAGGVVPAALLSAFWLASISYAVVQGLMYGTNSAIFMDVTNPAVAATQFTAYMALSNVAISYSATWQGLAIEAWGYPTTLLIDAIFGVACLAVLPFMKKPTQDNTALADAQAARRARRFAGVLGLLCLAYLPYTHWQTALGAGQPIAGTFFTLVFVVSALFSLGGTHLLAATTPALARLASWIAPLLLLMHARYYLKPLATFFTPLLAPALFEQLAMLLLQMIALAGACLLLALSRQSWSELRALQISPVLPQAA
jgi:PAT family beta-lactamase induction signal transducer AmpG